MTNLVGDSAVQSTPAVQGTNTAGGLGVYGLSTTGNAGSAGVQGTANAGGIGVYGTSNTGQAIMGEGGSVAILGKNYVTSGKAIQAWQNATSGYGVYSQTSGASGMGVYAQSTGIYGIGVYGEATGGSGVGLWANALSTGVYAVGGSYGVQGIYNGSGSGWSGYFNSNVYVAGFLSKAGGGFRIDHPVDPENKYLNHCFVESPEMKNVYDGVVTLDDKGEATVTMPSYFGSCNADFRYQLTAIGAAMPSLHISSEMKSGVFSMAGGIAGAKVSWLIMSTRADKWALTNNPGVEIEKAESEKGLFLHPELFGHGKEKSIHQCDRMGDKP